MGCEKSFLVDCVFFLFLFKKSRINSMGRGNILMYQMRTGENNREILYFFEKTKDLMPLQR